MKGELEKFKKLVDGETCRTDEGTQGTDGELAVLGNREVAALT